MGPKVNIKRFLASWPRALKLSYLLLFLISLFYLLLPSPSLPKIGKRYPTETGYNSHLVGEPEGSYFTNKSLKEIVAFYRQNYSHSPFLGLPLPVQEIAYDPQYVRTLINDMHTYKNTSFLVEFSHPGRESIFIKGFGETNPQQALKKKAGKRIIFKPEKGKEFNLKLVVYHIESPVWARVLILLGVFVLTPIILFQLWQAIGEGTIRHSERSEAVNPSF